jgi:hypothetical protein
MIHGNENAFSNPVISALARVLSNIIDLYQPEVATSTEVLRAAKGIGNSKIGSGMVFFVIDQKRTTNDNKKRTGIANTNVSRRNIPSRINQGKAKPAALTIEDSSIIHCTVLGFISAP